MIASVTDYHIGLGIHVVAIVVTFGVTFLRPAVFALATRGDPHNLPTLHRVEYTLERTVVAPGLTVAVASGIYLASWAQRWSMFYVWWGLGVATIIAGALGVVMIPTAKRATALAERDLRAGAQRAVDLSDEYRALTRRLASVGIVLSALVLITIFFMGIEALASEKAYYVVVAAHTMAVTITFGAAFVYPIVFTVVTRQDPRGLPALHRIEHTIERTVIVPGLLVVILTGVYATTSGHHWGEFYVHWGLTVAIVIGALIGYVMIPTAERAAAVAERDVAASAPGEVSLGDEYRRLARRLLLSSLSISGLVLVTILIMVVQFRP